MQGKDTNSPQDIRVSGVNHPLKFQLRKGIVTIEMPLPSLSEGCITQVEEGYLVKLDGIIHLLIRSGKYGIDKCNAFVVCKSEPVEFSVWVREMGTIFDETACGTGTYAIGLAKAYKQSKSIEEAIIQPSGERIIAKVSWDDKKQKPISASISGKVEVLYDGPVSFSV
ncbi:MAG: hypothetical protein ACOCXP_03070 [Candidatus Dojkabacteria bacterium]